jgi:hypothetical protein
MNNLYIINEVLFDYTYGMAVISAPSLDRCREIFIEEFIEDSDDETFNLPEYDSSIEMGKFTAIERVDHPEGLISYVYGGS